MHLAAVPLCPSDRKRVTRDENRERPNSNPMHSSSHSSARPFPRIRHVHVPSFVARFRLFVQTPANPYGTGSHGTSARRKPTDKLWPVYIR